MSDNIDTRKTVNNLQQEVRQLRDQLRVRIHLGGLELRDAFAKIEREADHLASKAEPKVNRALEDIGERLRRIAQALDGK